MVTCICIPTFNEESNIYELLTEILWLDPHSRVIVVDNGSTDNTLNEIKKVSKQRPARVFYSTIQKGCGIRKVYMKAFSEALKLKPDYIIGMDAGYSHDPLDISLFVLELSKYQCVFGSRILGVFCSPLKRKGISYFGGLLSKLLLGLKQTDPTSGFVGFRREVVEQILLCNFKSNWHFWDTELKFYCKKYSSCDVPISYTTTTSSFKLKYLFEGIKTLWYLILK